MNNNPIDSDSDSLIDEDLDTSWILEYEKMSTIQQNYIREPMETIDVYFLYINANSYIEKIVCEKEDLVRHANDSYGITKERVLKLIQTKRELPGINTKYKLMDLLVYNMDLESENIQSFAACENLEEMSQSFFKVLPIFDDIHISPSIFIFHEVNALFFIFNESKHKSRIENENRIRSILKHESHIDSGTRRNIENNRRTTKKVRITIPDIDDTQNNEKIDKKEVEMNHRKSMKLLSHIGSRTTKRHYPKIN